MEGTDEGQLEPPKILDFGPSDTECPLCEQTIPEQVMVSAKLSQGRTFLCSTPGCTETFLMIKRGHDRFEVRFSP